MEADRTLAAGRWLKREDFQRVQLKDIRNSVSELSAGRSTEPFKESTDYDVVLPDGSRYAPKAVFGLAARQALHMDIRPKHFRGGIDTPCFRAIEAAGFGIEPKREINNVPANPADEWLEGKRSRVAHVRYERNRNAARRKKENYRELYGHLSCEECGLIPSQNEEYGTIGDACIEVHHKVPLANLGTARRTRIEDLMCVCANCHRILHQRLRNSDL